METIKEFATRHRLHAKPDGCGDPIILGKDLSRDSFLVHKQSKRREFRSHVFEGFDGRLGVCLMYAKKQQWRDARRMLESVGCIIRQDGETEGTAAFDPANTVQTELALRLIRKAPKIARAALTEEQRKASAERLAAARMSKAA